MTECPTCNLSMESHSTSELMECCMKQVNEEVMDEKEGMCPNCKHEIKKHTNKGLAECTLEFLKSGINN
jgi:primosomal protein N'